MEQLSAISHDLSSADIPNVLDLTTTFSATLRATSFRVLLSLAAGKKMRMRQFDVSNAFTQAFMDDTIMYVEPNAFGEMFCEKCDLHLQTQKHQRCCGHMLLLRLPESTTVLLMRGVSPYVLLKSEKSL